MVEGEAGEMPTVAVVLEHKDPGLALPLFESSEADEAFAEWRSWSQVLGVPQLVADDEGGWREPFARMGGVLINRVKPRPRHDYYYLSDERSKAPPLVRHRARDRVVPPAPEAEAQPVEPT